MQATTLRAIFDTNDTLMDSALGRVINRTKHQGLQHLLRRISGLLMTLVRMRFRSFVIDTLCLYSTPVRSAVKEASRNNIVVG